MSRKKWVIEYCISRSGKNHFSDFLDKLTFVQQAKILKVIGFIKRYGLGAAIPHTKKLSGTPLWEIRIKGKDSIRVVYVIPRQKTVIILHGFIKKKQKIPQKEIKTSLLRYREYVSRVRRITK